MSTYVPGERVEFLSGGRCGSRWYPAEFVMDGHNGQVRITTPDLQPWVEVPAELVRRPDSAAVDMSSVVQWWEARLHVRAPAGEHRMVIADVTTGIQVAWRSDPAERREAARKQAEAEFRTLGLGTVMDLPYATVHIEVTVA